MINFENKKKLITLGISCAIIFIVLYLITNISAVSGFFSSIFAVLSPIVIGAAIAYILNPLLKLFEFKVFKKMKSKAAPVFNIREIIALCLCQNGRLNSASARVKIPSVTTFLFFLVNA